MENSLIASRSNSLTTPTSLTLNFTVAVVVLVPTRFPATIIGSCPRKSRCSSYASINSPAANTGKFDNMSFLIIICDTLVVAI